MEHAWRAVLHTGHARLTLTGERGGAGPLPRTAEAALVAAGAGRAVVRQVPQVGEHRRGGAAVAAIQACNNKRRSQRDRHTNRHTHTQQRAHTRHIRTAGDLEFFNTWERGRIFCRWFRKQAQLAWPWDDDDGPSFPTVSTLRSSPAALKIWRHATHSPFLQYKFCQGDAPVG